MAHLLNISSHFQMEPYIDLYETKGWFADIENQPPTPPRQ